MVLGIEKNRLDQSRWISGGDGIGGGWRDWPMMKVPALSWSLQTSRDSEDTPVLANHKAATPIGCWG